MVGMSGAFSEVVDDKDAGSARLTVTSETTIKD